MTKVLCWLHKGFGFLCGLIFPRRCPICGDIVSGNEKLACPSCKESLQVIQEPRCKKCSKPIENHEKEYCYDCSTRVFQFEKGYALWVYDNQMKGSIAAFKYLGRREYVAFYTEEFIKYYGGIIKEMNPDAFVPVPLHYSKQRKRGFNQAELFACSLGKELNIPVWSHVLRRNRKTLPQKELNDKDRLKNLSQAFSVEKIQKSNLCNINKIILVDDIYTTGSTIEACSRVLKRAGVKQIYFVSLCIGRGY